MPERNLLASFATVDDAQKAQQALHQAGYTDTQVDQIGQYPGEGIQQVMNPLTGNVSSLAELTLDADITNRSAGILAAADVSASGMSDGGAYDINQNVLLTVVTGEKDAERAEEIIRQFGGNV